MPNQKSIVLFLGPILFAFSLWVGPFSGLSVAGHAVLSATVWIALWWIFEVVPISVTALLPIVLFPLAGGLDLPTTTAAYGHKYIFLYMGGFMIAIALEKWNLHKRIALTIIDAVGTQIDRIVLGFMLATAFLSMWISNTATAVLMLPIGMAIVKQLQDNPETKANETSIFGKMLMLAIAYSASIGGVATLIGTPPNLVLAGVINEVYSVEITFLQWFIFGLPISISLLFIGWFFLTRFAFSLPLDEFPGGKAEVKRFKEALGPMRYEEKVVALIFGLTAFCWISRSYLLQPIFPALDDTIIAIGFGVLLFLIPDQRMESTVLKWEEAVRMPWGIILLFGGGMALAKAFDISGLALWIGTQMNAIQGLPLFLIVFVIIAAVNFLTEITSNLATTAMLLPILAPIALQLDVHPYVLMVGAACAASCAFMLPVATPPNAVVFGSGYLQIKDMVRAGIVMNLVSIALLVAMVYLILPWLWDFDSHSFPTVLR
ncbi:MAG: SLC13 family permease [Flavobacteriaceae bacterium]